MTTFHADFTKPCSWVVDSHIFEPRLHDDVIAWLDDLGIKYDFRIRYRPKTNSMWNSIPSDAQPTYLTCYIYIEDPKLAMLFKLTWL